MGGMVVRSFLRHRPPSFHDVFFAALNVEAGLEALERCADTLALEVVDPVAIGGATAGGDGGDACGREVVHAVLGHV